MKQQSAWKEAQAEAIERAARKYGAFTVPTFIVDFLMTAVGGYLSYLWTGALLVTLFIALIPSMAFLLISAFLVFREVPRVLQEREDKMHDTIQSYETVPKPLIDFTGTAVERFRLVIKENGVEKVIGEPWMMRVRLENHPKNLGPGATATDCAVRVEFYAKYVRVEMPFTNARWASRPLSSVRALNPLAPWTEVREENLRPNREYAILIALKYDDDEHAYALDIPTTTTGLWKNEDLQLSGDDWRVRVVIDGENLSADAWFSLVVRGKNEKPIFELVE